MRATLSRRAARAGAVIAGVWMLAVPAIALASIWWHGAWVLILAVLLVMWAVCLVFAFSPSAARGAKDAICPYPGCYVIAAHEHLSCPTCGAVASGRGDAA